MAIDLLEWHHDEVRFAIEGKLLFTQPNDNNWRKGRTIKLTPVNALLVTNGKVRAAEKDICEIETVKEKINFFLQPTASYKVEKVLNEQLNFPRHTGIREASLLLVREKSGRYTLLREPLFLDRCIVCTEADWEDYFEVQEISSKDTFIFKVSRAAAEKKQFRQKMCFPFLFINFSNLILNRLKMAPAQNNGMLSYSIIHKVWVHGENDEMHWLIL